MSHTHTLTLEHSKGTQRLKLQDDTEQRGEGAPAGWRTFNSTTGPVTVNTKTVDAYKVSER